MSVYFEMNSIFTSIQTRVLVPSEAVFITIAKDGIEKHNEKGTEDQKKEPILHPRDTFIVISKKIECSSVPRLLCNHF